MTSPEENRPADEGPDGAIETGALAAASEEDESAGDPLGPLNRVSEELAPDGDS